MKYLPNINLYSDFQLSLWYLHSCLLDLIKKTRFCCLFTLFEETNKFLSKTSTFVACFYKKERVSCLVFLKDWLVSKTFIVVNHSLKIHLISFQNVRKISQYTCFFLLFKKGKLKNAIYFFVWEKKIGSGSAGSEMTSTYFSIYL